MSKHEVITDNLTALTKSSSFERAVKGWVVERLVKLLRPNTQSCELCGTQFRLGARVRHQKSRATILVGGTCLTTLQRHRFPPRFRLQHARELTVSTLRFHYGSVIHPGNWIKWIIENAPKRLAQPAADLRTFGAVLYASELDALIRFHDRKRLFTRDALLSDVLLLETLLRVKIPTHITMDQAATIERKAASRPAPAHLSAHSEDYTKRFVRPCLDANPDLRMLWRGLTPLEQRAITALAALDKRAYREGGPLCTDDIAVNWPVPLTGPMVVWNPRIGLGFVGPDVALDVHKAHVWLLRSRRYGRKIYNLQYWRGVVGCDLETVQSMEHLAFQDLLADIQGLRATRANA